VNSSLQRFALTLRPTTGPQHSSPSENRRMPVSQAPLFEPISARTRVLSQREVILGQNLANEDTPNYRPPRSAPDRVRAPGIGAAGVAGRPAMTRNAPLARALRAGVELGAEAPPAHYRAVAEVIGYVMRPGTGH
jgi:FlhB/HrpN/YscU/SpaS family protein